MADNEKIIISIDKERLAPLPKDAYEVIDKDKSLAQFKPDVIAKLEKQVFDFFTLSQMGKSLLSIQRIDELSHVFLSSVYEASEAANCAADLKKILLLILDKARDAVEAHEYPSKQGKLKVTVSLGVSTFPHHARDKEALIGAADKALYRAKESGRNKVELAVSGGS